MFKRLLSLAVPLLILPVLLFGGAADAAAEKPKEVGQYVDLQPVALPIVVDGQLVNYVYVYLRVNLKSGVDVSRMRAKEPFFRDALVRDAHRTPFIVPGNWQKIDEAKLTAAMARDAAAITGPDVVASVIVTSQAPQKPAMPPRPVKSDHP